MSEADRDTGEVRRLANLVATDVAAVAALPVRELDLALRIARRARLLGRLAHGLKRAGLLHGLPPVAREQLESALVMAAARSRLARWELDRIAWALRGRPDIPLVALKGCAYLLLDLPNAGGRVFADVDLLTAEQRLEEVESVLNASGWQSQELTPYDQNYYRRWTHELPPLVHREREMEIDLHHNVVPRTARLKPPAGEMLAASQPLSGSRYRVPADADIVLHAMTHLMFDSDLTDKLRDLVDIADLLDHFAVLDADFWQRLVARAGVLDLERPAYYALRYAARLLQTQIPPAVESAAERWAPPSFVVGLMDRLVPAALYPPHPDGSAADAAMPRFLLYVRSHWLRMPPWLLAYHLGYKLVVRGLRRGRAH